MSEKVLFVDDDQNILNGVSRQFRNVFDCQTVVNPTEALSVIDREGPFAVVVSDMRMPEMNGVTFLSEVKEQSPDTVRIMLTGFADLQTTIDAVNEGRVFRFLSKPCSSEALARAVADGLAQYRLLNAERELLEGTLLGSIRVMSEMLAIARPRAFGRTNQVQRIALAIGEAHGGVSLWHLKIASMLSTLGCITVPEATLEQVFTGREIPEREKELFFEHALAARDLIGKIPRLEPVANIVGYQNKAFDGSGIPDDPLVGEDIPLGARILKVASEFEIAYRRTSDANDALYELESADGLYDPKVIDSLRRALRNGLCRSTQKQVPIHALEEGMSFAADVCTKNNRLMVTKGQEVTAAIRKRLMDLYERGAIDDVFSMEILGEIDSTQLSGV